MLLKSHYKALAKVAAREDGRYAMSKLLLDGPNLVATDGRRLAVVPVERDTDDTDGFVTQEAILAAYKAKKRPAALIANGNLKAPLANFTQTRPEGGADTFPRYKAVVPTFNEGDEGTVTIALNADLLAGLQDALCEEGGYGLRLTLKVGLERPRTRDGKELPKDMTHAADSPMLVVPINADGRTQGYGVLMPMSMTPAPLPKPEPVVAPEVVA